MSTILVLCVIAAAAWLVTSLAGRAAATAHKDSVEDFSRALTALSPQAPRTAEGREPSGRPRRAARRPAPTRTRRADLPRTSRPSSATPR